MGRKIVVISDLHCGHKFGLTPPHWQTEGRQRELWKHYSTLVKRFSKPDILIVNGDCIEGKGARNGGIELIASDRHEQGEMARQCLEPFDAKKVFMTFGTPYHTGPDENFERPLADKLNAQIENRLSLDINGLMFDIRHHAPGSQTPYGPTAGLQREKIMALLDDRARRGDIIVRSHVHKYYAIIDRQGAVFTTPCLQTHTEYGARRCAGDVDLGFMVFDVKSRREWSWQLAAIDVAIFRRAPVKA